MNLDVRRQVICVKVSPSVALVHLILTIIHTLFISLSHSIYIYDVLYDNLCLVQFALIDDFKTCYVKEYQVCDCSVRNLEPSIFFRQQEHKVGTFFAKQLRYWVSHVKGAGGFY